jgi:hypothetical protein
MEETCVPDSLLVFDNVQTRLSPIPVRLNFLLTADGWSIRVDHDGIGVPFYKPSDPDLFT